MKKIKGIRWRIMAKTRRVGKPRLSMISPPAAGPTMLAMDGIIMEKRLTERARMFDSLSLNCRS